MILKRRQKFLYGESSAASDVAFLLIIYFMVIAGFHVNQGFVMNLPARDSVRLVLKDGLLYFDMDEYGSVFHEGNPLPMTAAEQAIGTAVASRPDLAVVLIIDPAAPWQYVVSFVELAERLQVQSFSFRMKAAS